MRISGKIFMIGLGIQLLYFLLLLFMPVAKAGSGSDLIAGLIAAILYIVYLIPIAVIYIPVLGNEPLPAALQVSLVGLAALFYAFLIALAYSLLRRIANLRSGSIRDWR